MNAKVLLIEDSKFLRIATERALLKAGFQVVAAADGEGGLKAANESLPDIILLDMMLPKISGLDVLKALKANSATVHIPVIVLTSLSQRNEEKLVGDGAVAYIEKSALGLDEGSSSLVAAMRKIIAQVDHQKKVDLRLRELAAKKAVAG